MNPKISIIIPAFNASKTIKQSIMSVLHQSLKDIEVIAIDDGSNDNTWDVMKRIASKDSRLKVFHQENQGVSAARNLGIKAARGRYVQFCDADDYISPNMCQYLYDNTGDGYDIVSCEFYKQIMLIKQKRKLPFYGILKKKSIENKIFPIIFNDNNLLLIVTKIYNKDFILDNHLEFPLGWNHAEDTAFSMMSILCAETINLVPGAYYHYVKHIGAKSLTTEFRPNSYFEWRQYRHFIEESVYPKMGIEFDPRSNYINIIINAEKCAYELIKKSGQKNSDILERIFHDNEYRTAIMDYSPLSVLQEKEKDAIRKNNFDLWKSVIFELHTENKK